MLISLIIPTFNRPELLELGLWSIRRYDNLYPFDLEIIVVNDGILDETEGICKKYNATYYFTGGRNIPKPISRVPAFALNFGVKKANGTYLILSCPEIFHINEALVWLWTTMNEFGSKSIVVPRYMYFDETGKELEYIKNNREKIIDTTEFLFGDKGYESVVMPFLMMLYRQEFISIGGYDEDFIGYACDDNDFVDRLVANGLTYRKCAAKIIHLHHGNMCNAQVNYENKDWVYNYTLYKQRQGIIIRNTNKEWGLG